MVKKLFWENPYLTELETTVESVNENVITLKETILFAQSGGQESDTGLINEYKVILAQMKDREIFYTIENGHNLSVGTPVNVKIDWDRRYRLMKLHFAAEIVLEWVYRLLPMVEKVGAHIGEGKARIDFLWPESISKYLPEIEENTNQMIKDDILIRSEFTDAPLELRRWGIANFAEVACGGTHIRSTGEIGEIKLKRNNIGKGKERIEIYIL